MMKVRKLLTFQGGAMSNLVDPSGNPIKTATVPIIQWKAYQIPLRLVSKEDAVPEKGSVSPLDVIKELRAVHREMIDRFNYLSIGLSTLASKNQELADFLKASGLQLTDYQGRTIFDAQRLQPESP